MLTIVTFYSFNTKKSYVTSSELVTSHYLVCLVLKQQHCIPVLVCIMYLITEKLTL